MYTGNWGWFRRYLSPADRRARNTAVVTAHSQKASPAKYRMLSWLSPPTAIVSGPVSPNPTMPAMIKATGAMAARYAPRTAPM